MTREQIKSYAGQIVKVQDTFDGRTATFIASVKSVSESGMVSFGHPYDEDMKETTSGSMTTRCDCIDGIVAISYEKKMIWLESYIAFHKMIMEEMGYDSCEERLRIEVIPESE